jgi:PTS system N-acetylglucosamine-specific IIC component
MAEVKTTSSEQGAKTNKIVKAKRSERKAKGGTTAWSKFLTLLQELGKTLQFPIAMLPFAAILNRFGALGIQYTSETVDGSLHITNEVGYWISFIIQKPGGVAFDNLPLMFAIGVAFGLAKDHRGEVALVGALFYLILAAMTGSAGTLPEMIYKNVLTFTAVDGTPLFKSLCLCSSMRATKVIRMELNIGATISLGEPNMFLTLVY